MKKDFMKFAAISLIAGSLLPSSLVKADSSNCVKKRVMLTAFEPWNGASQNGSEVVASRILKEKLGGDDVNYTLCILPVEYDKASRRAEECLERMNSKPDVVISMGEGGCNIEVEVRAHNLDDDSTPNNAGVIRRNHVIAPGSDSEEFLTLPVADMICASSAVVAPKTVPSLSPGYYVCNNTAFNIAEYLKPKQVPFGFIHVPPVNCKTDPEKTARKIHTMVRAAIRSLGESSRFSQANPRLSAPSCASDPLPLVTTGCRDQVRREIDEVYTK